MTHVATHQLKLKKWRRIRELLRSLQGCGYIHIHSALSVRFKVDNHELLRSSRDALEVWLQTGLWGKWLGLYSIIDQQQQSSWYWPKVCCRHPYSCGAPLFTVAQQQRSRSSWPVIGSCAEYESVDDQMKIKEAICISAILSQPSLNRNWGNVSGCIKETSSYKVLSGQVLRITVWWSALNRQGERLLSYQGLRHYESYKWK